jgi:Rps23 Pro-64 3,4-dihydroxylase Tpa1-like proline 4-hydroxylase
MIASFLDLPNNFSIAIVDNFYSETELKEIKDELKLLSAVAELKVFVNNSAKDEENNIKQKSNSFFLDNFYSDKRELSKVLNANRKLFSEELRTKLVNKNLFYNQIFNVDRDTTLLNFYKPTDYYKPHKDSSCFTALTFFTLEEFYGGDLIFPEYNIKVSAIENRLVIFPGFVLHGSEEVTKGIRVSMAQFLNYRTGTDR